MNSKSKIDRDGHEYPPSPASSNLHPGRRYNLATELVFTEHNDQFNSSSVPIYQSATFKQDLSFGGQEYDYTRSGNPTRSYLERHLAKIMNARRALTVTSGMGALDVITRLLHAGDQVITGMDVYGGTHRLLGFLSTNNQITVHYVDTSNLKAIQEKLNERTKMILVETPTNPLLNVVDIQNLINMVRTSAVAAKALIVIDNSMMSPLLQTPLEMGADVHYESGTKYLSGHHDVMAGVIATNDPALADAFYFTINSTGCGLAPFDAFLFLRGLKTLAVRMEKQQANAIRIARFLERLGFKVRYPGLESHPQYELHKSQSLGPGAVLSFETNDIAVSEKTVENCLLWAISVSFGSVNSIISMPCRMSHASIDLDTRKERKLPEDIIRLCVGIEGADDLIDDLKQALVRAGAVKVTVDGIEALIRSKEAEARVEDILVLC